MNKLVLRCLGLAAMVVLVTLTTGLGTAADAGQECHCSSYFTAYASGMAESCADALADLHAQLANPCGGANPCDLGPVMTTSACYFNNMGGAWWKIDGKRTYSCEICIDIPDP
jgi:hypothetical protein